MYKEIADYGLIGDMHTVALVSSDGSIDYCSLPHLDSPTVFASLLDDEKGGFFRIQPLGKFSSEQRYLENTNILSCEFKSERGWAQLYDFMPVASQELFEKELHLIHRCLKVREGRMDFRLECLPRPDYARELPEIEREGNFFRIRASGSEFSLILKLKDYQLKQGPAGSIVLEFSLQENQSAHFDFIYGDKKPDEINFCELEETQKFWLNWLNSCIAGQCRSWGEHSALVNRSLLVLKLLTFQPSGAISASATTSLPEAIGGERNWDYRFTWIRDASFTLKALFNFGHLSEADSFIRWLYQTFQKHASRNLQIMYSLRGESDLKEKILSHLKGYRDSRPVRIGNDAFQQEQWDIYGEVMDTALRLSDYTGKLDEKLWPFFKEICNLALKNWTRPDYGIWEVRSGRAHFVYSKVMCWVALDRGIKIARRYGFSAPLDRWEKERERIKEEVLQNGYHRELNSFLQCYGSKELDASLLLLPLVGFLPIQDERIQGTIQACRKHLLKEGFLLRYQAEDGLQGEEGAFLLCNFWLIECLALSGRIEQAKELLTRTVSASNHLGLFSEEYDYVNKKLLGNFPQAFSHIGFLNSIWTIAGMEARMLAERKSSSWRKKMQKLIPLKIILNKSSQPSLLQSENIAQELKLTLNSLQGAFFDIYQGKVNYKAMKESESYQKYLELAGSLNLFDPFRLRSDQEKKAFWINIYNILIIQGVIELEIEHSVKEVFNFFERIGYLIGGMFFSPDDIEHGILRSNRPHPGSGLRRFSFLDRRRALSLKRFDPRIHFALVCASNSCPPIEFYDSNRIEEQLDLAGRSFLNRRGLVLDREKNLLYLSQIFKWYASDFGSTKQDVLRYIIDFLEEDLRRYLLQNMDKLKVRYLPYDWNLNRTLE